MTIKSSILISSYERLPLFRRTLHHIMANPPSGTFEVVMVDDGSKANILGELEKYKDRLNYTFVRFDREVFEKATGLKKFHNCPCTTNNIAFAHSRGSYIFQQGNEVIPFRGCYNQMLAEVPIMGKNGHPAEFYQVFSKTLDMPQFLLDTLDEYGTNLDERHVAFGSRWPLQSPTYRAMVTNYISLCTRHAWEAIGGYDERYYGGISKDDSDFSRRLSVSEGYEAIYSDKAVSLHQFHNGKTCYYDPPKEVISQERWDEGCAINRTIYEGWDGLRDNPCPWKPGAYGVGEVITNSVIKEGPKFNLVAESTLAYDSPDHLVPCGTKYDSSRFQPFNDKLYALHEGLVRVLDLGCAGGGFVKNCLDDGHVAVGLEGSDYCLKNQIREWRTIPANLFTCDIGKVFYFGTDRFNVATAWEVMEHIPEDRLSQLISNVWEHLWPGGLWIMSVCPNPHDGDYHPSAYPRRWWVYRLTQYGLFQLRDDLLDYFGDDWIRGPQQRAGDSFHLVLEKV